ncbi:MAG: aspartate/glutamate racemase family protein [Desulfobacterales bacterium]|nr:aspartate/glutamate racemase family protein [Desulfobacterales bacterium]
MKTQTPQTQQPFIGIIMLDTLFPRIKGDIGNPETFSFPVRYRVVKGASPERMVIKADRKLLSPFIEAGQSLVRDGAAAIATSCGFLALFHRELVRALDVPVFSSSLLQVHTARAVIHPDRKIGIITARKAALTRDHLAGAGIDKIPLAIQGMDDAEEFSSVFINGKTTLNREKCAMEMKAAARNLINRHPDVGAIVLECTNMPPYSGAVKQVTGSLPVFDCVTMLNQAYAAVSGNQN